MPITDYYVTTDAMGSVMAVLDESGNVLERRSYDAFGEVTYMLADGTVVPNSPTGVDIGFQGQLMDELTGMYQMGYRWYSPVLGRWVSRDPIGLGGGDNPYSAFGNSPIGQLDLWGLKTDSCSEEKPTSKRPITYKGEISYHALYLVLGYGLFEGTVTSDTDPPMSYKIGGRIDGVGFQIGGSEGQVRVEFTGGMPEDMLGPNGGFWIVGGAVGFKNFSFVGIGAVVSANLTHSGPEIGEIDGTFSLFGISPSISAIEGGEPNHKVGLGVSASFWGITVQKIEPVVSK